MEEHGEDQPSDARMRGLGRPPALAIIAVAASLLIAQAAAHPQEEEDVVGTDWAMIFGCVLMFIGACRALQGLWWALKWMCSLAAPPALPAMPEEPVVEDEEPDESCSMGHSEEYDDEHVKISKPMDGEPSSSGLTRRSGSAEAMEHVASLELPASSSTSLVSASRTGTAVQSRKPNPWNDFQRKHRGKGWSADKMRAEYYKSKGDKLP